MFSFLHWLWLALVVVALAVGVNKVRRHGWEQGAAASVIAVILLVVLVPPLQLLNRVQWAVQFGAVTTTSAPPRVDLCGRRFYPSSETVTLAQARAQEGGPLGVVAHTPAGTPILANPLHAHSGDCIITLYVETKPNSYTVYPLSGGP